MERIEITENELLQALQDAMQQADNGDDAGFVTTQELRLILGCPRHTVYRLMDLLKGKGVKIEVRNVVRYDRAMRPLKLPAYRISRDEPLAENLHD